MDQMNTRAELAERLRDILAVEIKAREGYDSDISTFRNFLIRETIEKIRDDETRHISMLRQLISSLSSKP